MAVIIDGKTLRDKILDELRAKTSLLNAKPSLSVIIVGDDPASKIYVNTKKKKALEIGFRSEIIEFDKDVAESVLLDKINQLNSDKDVNAILVQLPLPAHIDTKKVIETIDPIKDVDCFHPYNAGKIFTNSDTALYPCTPKGIIRLLEEYNVDVHGKNVVIVGRSNIVGRPLAAMLTNLNATVTLCHSKTDNISYYTKNADIVISPDSGSAHIAWAVNKPEIITLFFATSAKRTAPYGEKYYSISANISCSPCMKKHCKLNSNPNKCTRSITSEQIINIVKKVLQ